AEHVALLGELPAAEVRDVVTKLWDRGGLEDALLPLFARRPTAADRDKFLAGLRSPQPGIVATAAKALRELPAGDGPKEIVALVRALRRLPADEPAARKQVAATLRARTGADLGTEPPAWGEWPTRN